MLSITKRTPVRNSFLFFLLFLTGFSSSCSKDKVSSNIEGNWQGEYGFGQSSKGFQYGLRILPGGIIHRIDAAGNIKGSGTWEMTNNILLADFTVGNVEFSILAAVDAGQGKMMGNWGYYPTVDEGKWELTKTTN